MSISKNAVLFTYDLEKHKCQRLKNIVIANLHVSVLQVESFSLLKSGFVIS